MFLKNVSLLNLFKKFFERKKEAFQKNLGKVGEELAVNYLKKKGYCIIERNFKCPLGEIDIIAEKRGCLIFIEVKTRKRKSEILPEDSVDSKKQKKLKKVAELYINNYCKGDKEFRFDIVSIILEKDKEAIIKLIEDAF